MRTLITGGSGLIGRRLALDLTGAGQEVIVLSRDPEKARGRIPAGAQAIGWDGRSAEGWSDWLQGSYAIVNLAGENLSAGRWTAARKRRILESRTNAGRAILEAVRAAADKPQVVLQGSAVGYYGARGEERVSEDGLPGVDFQASVALQWEQSTAALEDEGVRRVISRTAVVLSPENPAVRLMTLPFKLFVGGKVGSGQQWFPWIHLEDCVAAMRFLLESNQASGPFNLAAPQQVSNADLSRTLGRVMRRPSWVPVPAFAMRLLFGEMSSIILEGPRAHPQSLETLGFNFRYPELTGALQQVLA